MPPPERVPGPRLLALCLRALVVNPRPYQEDGAFLAPLDRARSARSTFHVLRSELSLTGLQAYG